MQITHAGKCNGYNFHERRYTSFNIHAKNIAENAKHVVGSQCVKTCQSKARHFTRSTKFNNCSEKEREGKQ